MTEIGKNLKNARIEKGYTLDDLQQITKIQKRYLIAIEDEKFDALPGDFYVKAFVRQYAETVGMDPEELLDEIGDGTPKPADITENAATREDVRSRIESTRQSMAKTNKFNRLLSYLPTVIIVLIVVAILGSIYFVAWNNHQKTADSQQIQSSSTKVSVSSDDVSSNKKKATKKSSSQKDSSSSASSTSSKKKDSSSAKKKGSRISLDSNSGSSFVYNLKNSPKENIVKVSVKDASAWTAVSVDGTQQWQGTLSSGEDHELKIPSGASSIAINLGNSKATKIEINGRNFNFMKDNSSLTVRTLTLNIK
ncbi:transcriptional regulator [Liquorilactobacillus sucicola DSM 21376 = JCM 15457]|uniref:Transcriptional regulator n=1 Tax=Liquorilactobacillus sucicola DSM 21376 = JCM 15457 TaxID=1423806 RepID=A0A023CWI0_9LACO|nr:helix-turn-helix domain-containing protein [Liquorilactobacillus sucicola]KRN06030.1 transcriptional regulator [Liquorilactobacillus sucicola DSM 21376 = JCM 15457]GAJ25956.1 transcriptional regulator [Liquorilactobacillus sucicola DSM 21376 = JCM 15457]